MLLEQDPVTQGIFEYGRRESLGGAALDAWHQADINGTFDSVVTERAWSSDASGAFGSAAEYFIKQQSDQTEPPADAFVQPKPHVWAAVERQPTPRSARIKESLVDDRNSSVELSASKVETSTVPLSPVTVEVDANADEASTFGKVRPSWAQALYERREQKRGNDVPMKSKEALPVKKDPPTPVIDKDTQALLGEFVLDLDSIKRGPDGT